MNVRGNEGIGTNRNRKPRTCLKCGKMFDSTGPANRICRRCQQINAKLPRFTEVQLQQQRGEKRWNGEVIEELQ